MLTGFGLGRAGFVCAFLGLAAASGCSSGGDAAGSGGSGANGTGGTTTTTTGTGGTGATNSGGGGSGAGIPFTGTTRVDTAGGAADRSADLMVAPDGTIYVSWVDASADVHVARSTDGGATFEPSVTLDGPSITPIVSMARHPKLVADDDRVAIAWNDQAGTIYLYVSSSAALSFGQPILVGGDITTTFRDFPKPVVLSDGTLGVGYQGYPATGARIFFARESNSYLSEVASSGVPGVPCECCPLEAVLDSGGDLMLAFRNNDNNDRDMWFAGAPASGAFSGFAAASTTEGFIPACPMQGPRIAQTGANEHVMVWSGRGSTNPGAALMSVSTNGGGAWTGGAAIPGFMADEPTVALGPSGKLYVTGVTGNMQSALVVRDAGASTFSSPAALNTPDGSLSTPQALGAGGIAGLAGVSSAGTVWFMRME